MRRFVIAATLVILPALTFAADTSEPVPPGYVWELKDLYASPEAWTAAHDKALAEANKLDGYKGTLGNSSADMLKALSAISAVHKELDRLTAYAGLKRDEDVKISQNQERVQLAQALSATFAEKTSWLTPEVLSIGPEKVKTFVDQSAELKRRFAFALENTLRAKPHTLGDEAENVLAAAGNVLAQPDNIFSQLSNGELPFPSLTLRLLFTVDLCARMGTCGP